MIPRSTGDRDHTSVGGRPDREPDVSQVDLTDPDLYTHGDPHAAWRRLRRDGGVHWHKPMGFWAVTGYEPAKEVLHDWRRFTSTDGTMLRENRTEPFPGAGRMLVLTDPPRHTQLRKAMAHLFKPRGLGHVEEVARDAVRSVLRQALDSGSCDFVSDVVAHLPLTVSCGILGVELDDVPAVVAAAERAATAATHVGDPEGAVAHHELMLYFFRLLKRRERDAGDDLVSALLAAKHSGLGITDEEILLTCDNVVVAASETARHAASGGLLALVGRPSEWAALRSGRVPVTVAVEEILRWTSPATHIVRTAVADTSLNGVDIKAGDVVAVWTPSANRDDSVFTDAEVLRLDRSPNPHLTFGAGMHFCIGAGIVRVFLRVLFEELAERVEIISLSGAPQKNNSWVSWGLSSLPVAFHRPTASPAGSPLW